MKAVLCRQFGPPSVLRVEEVPSPAPGPGQLVVATRTCGVNFPDTLIIQGKYQFKPDFPFSPGGEVSGVVKEVGDGVTAFKTGDRVIAATTFGGYAEEVVADANRTLPIPDGMDFDSAAAFVLTYGTSHHALKDRAQLRAGETLLVLGAAGGVGLAAIELGKLMGARVIAAASSPEKLAVCKAHGADELIDYSSEDLRARIKALTDGKGVDVVYDPVGGDYSEPALRSIAWNGRFLVVGFAAGTIPSLPLNLPLLKGCAVVGVFWGGFTRNEPERNQENLAELAKWAAEGKLKPHISARYPLEGAAEALQSLMDRQVQGKVVLTTEAGRR
jgi:NADPH2:quinone reductase